MSEHVQQPMRREITYRAACECGWTGVPYTLKVSAQADFDIHRQFRATVQSPCQNSALCGGFCTGRCLQ